MIRFDNPILLAGVAAIVIPVVLHLLSRSRFRTVDWGAMMFLPGGDGRRRHASRLRQWLLLATRCGMLASLACALALPRIQWGHAPGAILAIIILDHSASMGEIENERSRMDRAREAAINVLAGLRPEDQGALLDERGNILAPPTGDLQSLAQQILATESTETQGNFASALLKADALCHSQSAFKSHIFIISDRQGGNWEDIDVAFIRGWKNNRPPNISWLPVGGKTASNVAIDSVQLLDPPAIENIESQVAIDIHNYGPAPRGSIHLTLAQNGRSATQTDLTLEARENRRVILPVQFGASGEATLTAKIDTADLLSDNIRNYVSQVTPRIPVLIVSGEETSGRFRRQADFLKLALAPFYTGTTRPAEDRRNPCIVRVVSANEFAAPLLAGVRVVILANISSFSNQQLRSLEQFTYAGGGVIIAPGSFVRADDFNQIFYRNATGISPAALEPPTSSDDAPTSILGIDLAHAIFQFLRQSPDPIPQVTIARYFPANPHGGDVRVLSSYATGEPFVIAGAFGRGHVLLVTTPLDAEWSNLPLSNFYLPFVQSCVKYLRAASMSLRDLRIDDMVEGSFPGDVDSRSVRILDPDGHTEPCEVSPLAERLEFRYGPVTIPGQYYVTASSPRGPESRLFIVAPVAAESDLTPLGTAKIQYFQKSLGITVVSENQRPAALGDARNIPLWLVGMALVVALTGLEMFLAGVPSRPR